MPCRYSILAYGDTRSGKTAQFGELAEFTMRTTGKRSRLYHADPGGLETIGHLIDVDIVDLIPLFHRSNPFEWLDLIARGYVLNADEKLVPQTPEQAGQVGLYGFEGFTSISDILLQDLAASLTNIGGGVAVTFTQGSVKVGGNNQAHYGIVQSAVQRAAFQSFRLSNPVAGEVQPIVMWTAAARRASDNDTTNSILGPQLAGSKQTSEAPRWFVYTFHLVSVPGNDLLKQKEEHRLYFGSHTDQTAPGSVALGNDRMPLGIPNDLPSFLSPASLPQALTLLQSYRNMATEAVRERMRRVEG